MIFDCFHLQEFIIKPALTDLVMYSDRGVKRVYNAYIKAMLDKLNGQDKENKYLSIYGMTAEEYNLLWQNFIKKDKKVLLLLTTNFECNRIPLEDRLIYDLRYASAMKHLFFQYNLSSP